MKTTINCFGVITFILAIGFSMAACDTGNGNENEKGNGYLIMGQFANQSAGIDATFYADTVTGRSARTVTAGQALNGKIEDGSIIFNLSGFYFPADGSFILSAGSSFLVYEIAGTVTSNGLSEAQATVKVNDGGDWTTIQIPVIVANEVVITGSTSSEQSGGLPASWLGSWNYRSYDYDYYGDCDICQDYCEGHRNDNQYYDITYIITPFGMTAHGNDAIMEIDLLEIERINDTTYDLVVLGEEGYNTGICSEYPNCEHNDCNISFSYMVYMKVRLERPNANLLKVLVYGGASKKVEEAGSLAYVRAINLNTATLAGGIDLTR